MATNPSNGRSYFSGESPGQVKCLSRSPSAMCIGRCGAHSTATYPTTQSLTRWAEQRVGTESVVCAVKWLNLGSDLAMTLRGELLKSTRQVIMTISWCQSCLPSVQSMGFSLGHWGVRGHAEAFIGMRLPVLPSRLCSEHCRIPIILQAYRCDTPSCTMMRSPWLKCGITRQLAG